MNDPTPFYILIAPIGDFEISLLDGVSKKIQECFGIPTKIDRPLDDLDFAKNNERSQYHSTSIIKELEKMAPRGALKVAALCQVDLFIPILTYVYGEAQLNGRACIVSTYRLYEGIDTSQESTLLVERITKEMIHELGHTFNLRHCTDPACLMHYCRNEKDVDRKSNRFCRYCKVLLEDNYKLLFEKPVG